MSSSSNAVQQVAALVTSSKSKTTGKQQIAMDGIHHAVSGQKLLMPADQLKAYLRSGAEYIAALRPVGYREEQLAQKIIDTNWWLNKSSALENNLLSAKSLENSSQGSRSTDSTTETILSQAMGFSDECGDAKSFEVLSRCAARMSQLFLNMTRELERVQEKRRLLDGDVFDLENCRVYNWYTDRARKLEELRVDATPEATPEAAPAVKTLTAA